jgi:uncharacterized protein YfdQ (DUF2303 family)
MADKFGDFPRQMPTPAAIPPNADSAAHLAASLARQLEVAKLEPRRGKYLDAADYVILRDASGAENLIPLTEHAPAPERKAGTVYVDDIDSFIHYWEGHNENGHIYAQYQPAQFIGVLNDHVAEEAECPGRRDHRVVYGIKHSPEWDAWTGHDGVARKFSGNEELAFFIEENMQDFVEPTGARMAEVALNFRLKADVEFTSVQRLQDGHIQFGYQNNVNADAGGAAIPETFRVRIPVFAGINARLYDVNARFRFRKVGSGVIFWYDLIRPHKVIEQAFRDLWSLVGEKTEQTIILGRPE